MPTPVSKRVIVIFPRLPEHHAIHEVRRRFDPLVGLIAPHLTLVFPFTSPLPPAELRSHMESSTRGVAPFEVRLRGVTAHESEYLFLNVKRGNDALVDLHARLYSGPLAAHLSPRHTFVPHLTVGRVRDAGALERALADPILRDVAFDFRADALTAYTAEDDGSRVPESVVGLVA
jgi:2'-5' RNA ligase